MQALKKILVADDDEFIRLSLKILLEKEHYSVVEAETIESVLSNAQLTNPDLVLLDMNFSYDTTSGLEGLSVLPHIISLNIPVILLTAYGSIELAVEGLKLGASDFIEKPWEKTRLLKSIEQQLELRCLKTENESIKNYLTDNKFTNEHWVCESESLHSLNCMLKSICGTDVNVLITGENGTGKSHLAKHIHSLSNRSSKPFISANMAAIPENLFESELFGHQKGSFTDAKQSRIGRFKLASSGTLFLDEIGALPISLQAKLLRVLESGEFEVLGTNDTQVSNARIISATNADLPQMIRKGIFRQDLLYRLNTVVLNIPPLRERKADIPIFIARFLFNFSKKYQKPDLTITTESIDFLMRYSWPGNVRELSHVIERAVLLSSTKTVEVENILIDKIDATEEESVDIEPLECMEKKLILRALKVSNGKVAEAANLISISRNALYRRMEKFGISYEG